MNAYRIFVIASLLQLGWCSADDARDYPVRDIPIESDKFRAIFATVSAAEMALNFQKLGQSIKLKLVQNIAKQKYLAELGDQLIAVDLQDGRKFADDTWIGVNIQDTGEIYEYIAVLGNKKSVRLYREVKAPPLLTIEEFVTRLKKGESFIIEITAPKIPCRICEGTGVVTDNSSNGGRKFRCTTCNGTSGSQSSAHYRVLW